MKHTVYNLCCLTAAAAAPMQRTAKFRECEGCEIDGCEVRQGIDSATRASIQSFVGGPECDHTVADRQCFAVVVVGCTGRPRGQHEPQG